MVEDESIGSSRYTLLSVEDRSSQCKDGTVANPHDCIVRITVSIIAIEPGWVAI